MARDRKPAGRDDARAKASERARERHRNTGRGSSGSNTVSLPEGVEFFKVEEGRNLLDVVPFTSTKEHVLEKPPVNKGELWWRVRYKIHRNVGANNESAICPTSANKKCPICEERGHLFDQGQKDEAKLLYPSERNLILVRHAKSRDKVAVLDISEFAFAMKLKSDLRVAEDDGMEDVNIFYWPDGKSYRLRCEFEETSFGSGGSFMKCMRVDFKEREPLDPDLLEQAEELNIQECLNVPSYDALRALFLGMDPPEEGDGDDDAPAPAPKKEESTKKRAESAKNVAVEEEDPPPREEDFLDSMNEDELLDEIDKLKIEVDAKALRKMDEDDLRDLIRKHDAPEEKAPPAPSSKGKDKPADTPKKSSSKGKDDRCPHGHQFGVDTDDKPECRECDMWPDCSDKKDG